MQISDGVYENLPFEEYAAIDAINGSSIVHMRRSPMFYRWMKDNPPPPTDAQLFGIAVHRLILEPNRVGDFAVWDLRAESGNLRPRNGGTWEAFKAENQGKTIITADERDAMVGMAVAARKCLPIRKYADAKGPTEVSLIWTDKTSGFRMKCRLDKWIPRLRTVFDLKSTVSCLSYAFCSQSEKLGYHIKMAIQGLGVKACYGVDAHLKLGAIEKKEPHESAVYNVPPDVRLAGLEALDGLLRKLKECNQTGNWPPAMEEESDLVLPNWATVEPDTEFELDMTGA